MSQKKEKKLLILIEQVMTNLVKHSVLAQIFTMLWPIYESHNYITLIIIIIIVT